MLYGAKGKPRVAIFSIAHLGDAERMFFVSLLLLQVVGWMRSQSGTTSLRALLYMDEIFGYLPPVANPPSKAPLLTLLKQARAFGVGIVLATQNPVDLDYKALSNAGTWFIGRLQTARDQQRVLDGLAGAAPTWGRFDRKKLGQILAGLGNRVFLMNNVHEDQPVLFETRWAMSYLRGPLTRDQIKLLMEPLRPAWRPARQGNRCRPAPRHAHAAAPRQPPPGPPPGDAARRRGAGPAGDHAGDHAVLPPQRGSPGAATLVYEPRCLGIARSTTRCKGRSGRGAGGHGPGGHRRAAFPPAMG
jgi:hypothetical protein